MEGNDDRAVTYVNSKTGFGSVRNVKSSDYLRNISDTDLEAGHRSDSIEQNIYIKIYLQIPSDHLALAVNPYLYSRV